MLLSSPDQILSALERSGHPVANGFPLADSADCVLQAIDRKRMSADFTIVTRGKDPNRHGTFVQIIEGQEGRGLLTDDYERNPLVMFGHGMLGMPFGGVIGTARDPNGQVVIRKSARQAVSRVYFSQTLPDASTLFAAVDEGIFNAASIQFRPLLARRLEGKGKREPLADGVMDVGPTRYGGFDFLESVLLEWSIVDIPADPGALRRAMERGQIAGERITQSLGRVFQSVAEQRPAWAPGFAPPLAGEIQQAVGNAMQAVSRAVQPVIQQSNEINRRFRNLVGQAD